LEVVSAAPYEGVARQLVAALKFSGRTGLAVPAAAAMARAWPEPEPRAAALVPAPGVGVRVRVRGFDPAALLARELARITGAELAPCLRRADRSRQVGRSRSERLGEGPRVLAGAAATRLAGRAVWLVDDVVTTGATLTACASALAGVGVRCAGALTLCRSA
jgi:predicted amidophosphoribosyltransferase